MSSPPPPPPPSKVEDEKSSKSKTHSVSHSSSSNQDFHSVRINKQSTFRVRTRYANLSVIGSYVSEFTTHHISLPINLKFINSIHRGSYGLVVRAHDTENDQDVAIKKVANVFASKVDGKRVLRELELNSILSTHENIVHIVDVFLDVSRKSGKIRDLYIVTKLYECDLSHIVSSDQTLTDKHLQYFMYQLLCGLRYVHSAHVLHRDLKPSNVLCNGDCSLAICDFGLARSSPESDPYMTDYVQTRYYRAPELICENRKYDEKVDVWSAGLIFSEMLTGRVLLQGKSTKEQLRLIIKFCGAPSESQCEHIESKAALKQIRSLSLMYPKGMNLKTLFQSYTQNENALDLLSRMLKFDPTERISLDDALSHPFLKPFFEGKDKSNARVVSVGEQCSGYCVLNAPIVSHIESRFPSDTNLRRSELQHAMFSLVRSIEVGTNIAYTHTHLHTKKKTNLSINRYT